MIRLLTAVLLFASFHVVAEVTLTDINNDEVADAEEVMGNFNALKQGVEANTAAIDALPAPPTNCTADKIIKWDDINDVWVCATDPLANLSCSAGDTLTYDGSAFTCACVPPGTAITDSNFDAAITDWFDKGNASQYGDITKWCTGAVIDMGEAFAGKIEFNEDIGGWDTSNVISMQTMFADAGSFNQNISGWDTSNVLTMFAMFYHAYTFNQPIGGWDTSNVIDMDNMFYGAEAFNQDLSSWVAGSLQACSDFATEATAWLGAYGGSIADKTPPLSASLIAAGCGN